MLRKEIAVIGGGIVGLATAYQALQRWPGCGVHVLEKEPAVGSHQSGRNSGVLHSGIYYTPGSLKATNCRAGKRAMEEFCSEHEVPYEICGKVIVAVTPSEVSALETIHQRGIANGVRCERIEVGRLRELEPHVAGVAALHVPETGIVDFRLVCQRLVELIEQSGGHVHTNCEAHAVRAEPAEYRVETSAGDFPVAALVNCAGLYSDRVTAMTGQTPEARIVPFRGEYYELKPPAFPLCRNLIYPVPDPKFPFLGVHFTRMIEGGVECGPNAVFAFAREGYKSTAVNLRDCWAALTYRGFQRLAWKYWRMGMGEMYRSLSKRAFVSALQRLIPDISSSDLVAGRAGVRAQAVLPNGSMVDDFLIQQQGRCVNVANAPSPAATSALNIGSTIVDRLAPTLVD